MASIQIGNYVGPAGWLVGRPALPGFVFPNGLSHMRVRSATKLVNLKNKNKYYYIVLWRWWHLISVARKTTRTTMLSGTSIQRNSRRSANRSMRSIWLYILRSAAPSSEWDPRDAVLSFSWCHQMSFNCYDYYYDYLFLNGAFFVADHEVIQEHSLPQIRSGINWLE